MPKKTREQKIIAQYRNRLKLLEQKQTVSQPEAVPESIPTVIKQGLNLEKKPVIDESKEDNRYRKFFVVDFKKSIIVIILIILIELVFYYFGIKK